MYNEDLLTMSLPELDRLTIMKQIEAKTIKQVEGAKLLKITNRQIKRLIRAYRELGAKGLISKRRGQASNNRLPLAKKIRAKKLVHTYYSDFRPTFAAEKLREQHKIKLSKETLRAWMIEWGLWEAQKIKKIKIHQSRARRSSFGELVQIDGSHHDWFEGRAEKCCLLVFIDDATSRLLGLRFEEQETTLGYFRVARRYMEQHGRPLAFYSDKYNVFRVNHPGIGKTETQWGRAMRELGVEHICAHSPQAKGRVERANGTLQDRLIKELRLKKINNIKTANDYLPQFIADWNKRFAILPAMKKNAHRKDLPDTQQLDFIFSIQEKRKLSKNLEISYGNTVYQIKEKNQGAVLRHAYITVSEGLFGEMRLFHKDRRLAYVRLRRQIQPSDIIDPKQLNNRIDEIKKVADRTKHPWQQPKTSSKFEQNKIQLPTTSRA